MVIFQAFKSRKSRNVLFALSKAKNPRPPSCYSHIGIEGVVGTTLCHVDSIMAKSTGSTSALVDTEANPTKIACSGL